MAADFDLEPPLNLGFGEAPAHFVSGSQKARIWTEGWAERNLYCPSCGADHLSAFPPNRKVADFYCESCLEEYELKSKRGKLGPQVADGAYGAMCERLAEQNNPSLLVRSYSQTSQSVTDLIVIPKYFFVQSIIIPRKPLGPSAQRAGWIGCNIQIGAVPDTGKISLVRDSVSIPRSVVLENWKKTLFLRSKSLDARGWLFEVLKAVESIDKRQFTLSDVYSYEKKFEYMFPQNKNVRPKIRQQLQVLRDQGIIDFLGRGVYRLA